MSLLNLPVEVLVNIFECLKLTDLRNVMLTCKAFKDIVITNNSIWRTVCRKKMTINNSTDKRKITTLSCYNQFRISNNWCRGIYNSKIVTHSNTNYLPWLNFHNSELLIFSVGSELYCFPTDKKGIPLCKKAVWNFEVPKVKRFDVRTNDISKFIMSGNLIVCGNRDGSTSVFVSEEMKQKPKLIYYIEDCHENGEVEVSDVEVITNSEKSCVITGSINSSNLLFWHFKTEGYPEAKVERDPSEFRVKDLKFSDQVGIRCLSLDHSKNKLAVGLRGSNMPLLVDINTSQLLMTAGLSVNCRQLTRDIRWHNPNTIMMVTHSGRLQLIDVRTHEVVYNMIDPFLSSLYCVKSDGERAILAGSSEYSRCVLFDTRYHASHVQIYFTQKKSSPVYSLDFDSTKLIAAADRSLVVLDFNVNSYKKKRRDFSESFEFVK